MNLTDLQQEAKTDPNQVIEHLVINPDLEDIIVYVNEQYRNGSPIVEDWFYDNILIEALTISNPSSDFLNNVEPESDEFFGKTVTLPARMLSTNKAYSLDTIEKWANDVEKVGEKLRLSDIMFRVTPKLDGYASYYDGKNLYTRGNGRQGSDITRALDRGLIVKNGTHGKGEIVVDKEWFKVNLSSKYENSRNVIASVIKEGDLDNDINDAIQSVSVMFVPFSELECWVGDKSDLMNNLELLWDEFVSNSRFDTDGLVIEALSDDIKDSMGFTNHHYRWQIAYKKNNEYHDIKVIGIIPQTSKNGRITPVVELEPTKISGVTVSKATGHHYGNLVSKGIDSGAIVKVCRSGLVIPYIEEVVQPVNTVNIPENCPSCGHHTVMDGDNLLCVNYQDCPAQIEGTIEFFFKTLGNCDGFGPRIIEQLCSNGITHIVEIYREPRSVIYNAGFTGKTAENLIIEIDKSMKIEIEDWRWLAAFSIPNIGKGGCEKLLKNHKLEDIFDLTINDIVKIDGFAEKSANVLVETLKQIKPYVNELFPKFKLKRTINTIVDSKISGKTLVFTGTMISGKRTDMEQLAKELGATVGSAVSSKTDFLICGENVGSNKLNAAKKYGVMLMTENQYLDLIS